jgi:hypothetical protein
MSECKRCDKCGSENIVLSENNNKSYHCRDCEYLYITSCNGTGTTPDTGLTDADDMYNKNFKMRCSEDMATFEILVGRIKTAERKRIADGLPKAVNIAVAIERVKNHENTSIRASEFILAEVRKVVGL